MKANRIWTAALVSAGLLTGILLSVRPWKVFTEQRAKTEEAQRKMHDAEQRRVDLTREKAHIEGTLGREQAARDLGFTKPDEQPVH